MPEARPLLDTAPRLQFDTKLYLATVTHITSNSQGDLNINLEYRQMYVTHPTDHLSENPVSAFSNNRAKAREARLKPGDWLFFEGDEVEWLYLIKSGVIRLTRMLENGRRQVISFGYPGDIIGFPADGLHHTDCESLTIARLQPIRRAHLESGRDDPTMHRALLQSALHEICSMQDHFMMLGRKSATERLTSFLYVLSERVGKKLDSGYEIHLPMSRADIADFLGLATETVSRTFTQLRMSKVIEIENIQTIIIPNPEMLLDLSLQD